MKASFLIPTNRNYKDYAQKVVDNIKKTCLFEKEILIFSPDAIEEEGVRWFKEESPSHGCIIGYNFLFTKSKGEFIFICNDEYGFANNASPHLAIEILEGSYTLPYSSNIRREHGYYYKDRKFKILGMGSPIGAFPNEHLTAGYTTVPNFGLPSREYRICGYPVFHRETIENHLDGYISHPAFKHHYWDNYLPQYAAFNGEPINDCPNSSLVKVAEEDDVITSYDQHDYSVYKSLVHDLFAGKTTNYVEKKPLETSKGTTPPKDLNIEGGAK
jgi:hypothetical protein